MKTFKIKITERFVKTIEVEAENYDEAVNTVYDTYYEDGIKLTDEDYFDTEIE